MEEEFYVLVGLVLACAHVIFRSGTGKPHEEHETSAKANDASRFFLGYRGRFAPKEDQELAELGQ